jgi:hypothetical protein
MLRIFPVTLLDLLGSAALRPVLELFRLLAAILAHTHFLLFE